MKHKEYGDFQTPIALAQQVLKVVQRDFGMKWSRVLEPTCGRGHFIQAALSIVDGWDEIIGIELQPDYVHQARQIKQETIRIEIIQDNIFTINTRHLDWQTSGNLLVIGNPPWVTNAELSAISSNNVPTKSNFKQHKGLDARTGQANFDVAEYIWIKLLNELQAENTLIALLCKTSVARKVFTYSQAEKLPIADARLYYLDAAKWFNAAVDACLLVVATGTSSSADTLKVYNNFESTEPDTIFGFHDGQLISNWATFQRLVHFYGQSQLEWRQGVKHDAASILELSRTELGWMNKLGELVDVEDNYCYPLLKSSDIRPNKMSVIDKAVILPQSHIGENTANLAFRAPHLWQYLQNHKSTFQQRKSSIYQNKLEFSIFGVGDYTFAEYKVLVSGFYKEPYFLPVAPHDDKAIVCDDTVYLLPCDSLIQAILVATLLNHADAQAFIQSMVFSDSKRPITKSLLQMVHLEALLEHIPVKDIHKGIETWAEYLHCTPNQIFVSNNKSDYYHLLVPTHHQLRLF